MILVTTWLITVALEIQHHPFLSLSLSPDAKLDAVELLLHSFGSAATFLNPQATRCSYLYSLEFDPSGTLVAAVVRVRRSWKLYGVGKIWVVVLVQNVCNCLGQVKTCVHVLL